MKSITPRASGDCSSILVINPNTNSTVTEQIRTVAKEVVTSATEIITINPKSGPLGVESASERLEAEANVISIIREGIQNGFDAFVLACFDDIGLERARMLSEKPVIGSCEAGFSVARTLANRFSVVTTYESAVPTICSLFKKYGVFDFATVQAAGISVSEAVKMKDDSEELDFAFRRAIDEDNAGAIILGSAALTGRAHSLSNKFNIPVIDGTAAAIKLAENVISLIRTS